LRRRDLSLGLQYEFLYAIQYDGLLITQRNKEKSQS